jgi:hypothetical protein
MKLALFLLQGTCIQYIQFMLGVMWDSKAALGAIFSKESKANSLVSHCALTNPNTREAHDHVCRQIIWLG